jgi:ACS family tartrate transporter-like MFS transporter
MLNEHFTDTASIEARTILKLKIRILPFVWLLYIVAFLDRINIGFAALTMNKELAITSQQFGFLAGIFFIGYSVCEIPSNLLLHKLGARIWLARILITWGILATLTGLVHSVHQLYAMRFLLGLAEGGYFPGILLYLTYWFRQREQAQAVALLITGIPVASILGAPFSGLILDHMHAFGLGSWRWLLILEGIPAVVCGLLTYFLLPSGPAEAKFLTQNEKDWIAREIKAEDESKRRAHSVSAVRALIHGRVWHLAAVAFCVGTSVYTANFWMPQIVKAATIGHSNTYIGLLVMAPNVVGLVLMIAISRSSDRRLERRWHTAVPAIVGGMACLSFGASHSLFVSITLLSLLSVGIYGASGPFWTLPSQFLSGFSAAAGIAVVSSIANLGGFAGPYAVGLIGQRTGSLKGGITLAGIALLVLASLVLLLPKKPRTLAGEFARPSADDR